MSACMSVKKENDENKETERGCGCAVLYAVVKVGLSVEDVFE